MFHNLNFMHFPLTPVYRLQELCVFWCRNIPWRGEVPTIRARYRPTSAGLLKFPSYVAFYSLRQIVPRKRNLSKSNLLLYKHWFRFQAKIIDETIFFDIHIKIRRSIMPFWRGVLPEGYFAWWVFSEHCSLCSRIKRWLHTTIKFYNSSTFLLNGVLVKIGSWSSNLLRNLHRFQQDCTSLWLKFRIQNLDSKSQRSPRRTQSFLVWWPFVLFFIWHHLNLRFKIWFYFAIVCLPTSLQTKQTILCNVTVRLSVLPRDCIM